MAKEIMICMYDEQWKRLEPHLPEGVCEKLLGPNEGAGPMLDCRGVPDEATYEQVLGIARTHCPDLVREIEKSKGY
jgi:hypothetical protein